MSLFRIAWRSVQQRGLASLLTSLSMALGVLLVVAVLAIHGVVADSFTSNASLGYNMIVGPKGGKLQLTLNTVYYLSQPIENLPYHYYLEMLDAEQRRAQLGDPGELDLDRNGELSNYVDFAIPVCLGDYVGRFRSVGTTVEFLDQLRYGPRVDREFQFAEGRNFHADGHFEAVVGSIVAREMGFSVGDTINPTHGDPDADGHVHEEGFEIVGVLKPSGTPTDRVVLVNMEGFYLMDDHAKPVVEGEHGHDHENSNLTSEISDHTDCDDPDCEHHHSEEAVAHEEHDCDDPDCAHHHGEEADAHEEHDCDDPECEHHRAISNLESEVLDHTDCDDPDCQHDHSANETDAHDHAAHEDCDHANCNHDLSTPLPINQREVTAILVRTTGDAAAMMFQDEINTGVQAQAVTPISEIYSLFDIFVSPIKTVLLVLTAMICIVSGISILVSIYNSMSERRHEIAVMRALGAGRDTVMSIILLESIILSVGGGFVGWFLAHGLCALASPYVEARTGVAISFLDVNLAEALLIPGLILLAVLFGLVPSWTAYRTDVAKSLNS